MRSLSKKGDGEWLHLQKLEVELQMSAAQRVRPHSSPAVSHVDGRKDLYLHGRPDQSTGICRPVCFHFSQGSNGQTHEDMPTTTRRIAIATPAHHQCAGPYHLTMTPSTHRQVPCHPTAGLLASEQKKTRQPQQQE
jgi:hypothetical protein